MIGLLVIQKRLIFLLIIVQTFIAVSVGCLATYFYGRKIVRTQVVVAGIDVTALNKEQMENELSFKYGKIISEESVKLSIKGSEFAISGNQIKLAIDIDSIWKKKIDLLEKKASFFDFFSAMIKPNKAELELDIAANDGLLLDALKDIAADANKGFVNASLITENGSIIKEPSIPGFRLNLEKTLLTVKENLSLESNSLIIISEKNGLDIIEPERKLDYYKGLDAFISHYKVKIQQKKYLKNLGKIALLLDGMILDGSRFDYKDYLIGKGMDLENTYDIHNIMASAIYGAILKTGIDPEQVRRIPHNIALDHLPVGLDVNLKEGGFSFNGTGYEKLMLNVIVDDDYVNVGIIGPSFAAENEYGLNSTIIQVYEPGIIYVEDSSIESSTELIVNEGKKGLRVNLHRSKNTDGGEAENELLYTDVYEPVSKIVKISNVSTDYIVK